MKEVPKKIWLDPICPDCVEKSGDVTWCASPDQPNCEECGMTPVRYNIDRRQLRAIGLALSAADRVKYQREYFQRRKVDDPGWYARRKEQSKEYYKRKRIQALLDRENGS